MALNELISVISTCSYGVSPSANQKDSTRLLIAGLTFTLTSLTSFNQEVIRLRCAGNVFVACPGVVLCKSLVRLCRWDTESLTLHYTMTCLILQTYSRLGTKTPYPIPVYFQCKSFLTIVVKHTLTKPISYIVTSSFIFY